MTTGIKQLYLNQFLFFQHVKTNIYSTWITCMCLLRNEIDFLVNAQAHKNRSKWQNAMQMQFNIFVHCMQRQRWKGQCLHCLFYFGRQFLNYSLTCNVVVLAPSQKIVLLSTCTTPGYFQCFSLCNWT